MVICVLRFVDIFAMTVSYFLRFFHILFFSSVPIVLMQLIVIGSLTGFVYFKHCDLLFSA